MLNDDGVINSVLMTEEAHFHLSGYANKQNYRQWLALTSLKTTKVHPLLTSERYVARLRNFCEPELCRRGIDLSSVWFQQDGATAHTASA